MNPQPKHILLSTAYLPPVQYISKFLHNTPVLIEKHENYQKQSYRNRCYIYGANGKQCLVIPVKKTHGERTPIGEVEIDYTKSWQKTHIKAIESAYRHAPFYEFYAEDIFAHIEKKVLSLFELNQNLLSTILGLLDIHNKPDFTTSFDQQAESYTDLRNAIHPKDRLNRPDNDFYPVHYQQAFIERYGFLANLSIIDLLFNEGSYAGEVLRMSVI